MASSPEAIAGVSDRDCSEMTVLVTGATSGVGREIALALGRLGATVLVHGRDTERGKQVVERLHDTAATEVQLFCRDFAHQENVRGLGTTVREQFDLDVLVNNAGCYVRDAGATADGIEYTMAVNHLAPFLLTHELAPSLEGGRVVTTSSSLHREVTLDPDSFAAPERKGGWRAYRRSKLANVLFTKALARRSDLETACFHPGFVPGSKLFRELPLPVRTTIRVTSMLPVVGTSIEDGAATAVFLAVSPDIESGGYFTECEQTPPSDVSQDPDLAADIWNRSLELTAITEYGEP